MNHTTLILTTAAELLAEQPTTYEIALRVNPTLRSYGLTLTFEYGGPNGAKDRAMRVLIEQELDAAIAPRTIVEDAVRRLLDELETKLFAGAEGM